jgi:hypothetical protein
MPRRQDVVIRALLLLGTLAACPAAKSSEAPKPAGPTCAEAAQHMVDEMAATKDPRPPDESLNAMIGMIQKRCSQDQWSSQAIACLAQIKSLADADQCGTLLTEAQQANLVKDQDAKPKPAPE